MSFDGAHRDASHPGRSRGGRPVTSRSGPETPAREPRRASAGPGCAASEPDLSDAGLAPATALPAPEPGTPLATAEILGALHQAGLGDLPPGYDPCGPPGPDDPGSESTPDLLLVPPEKARALELVQRLEHLQHAANALALRLGRTLAWIRAKDVAELGYPTYKVYLKQRVDIGPCWAGQLVRLVQAPLPQVREAVSRGVLPLHRAVKAPGQVRRGQESSWLFDACSGRGQFRNGHDPSQRAEPGDRETVPVQGAVRRIVGGARRAAGLVVGQPLSRRSADRFLHNCWSSEHSPEQILHEARKKPPAPNHPEPPDWGSVPDPATPLLGPWTDPHSVAEAAERVDRIQDLRQHRTLEMGRLYAQIVEDRLYRPLGFSRVADLVEQRLECSVRSLQRYRKRAEALDSDPAAVRAVRRGLSPDRVVRIRRVLPQDRVEPWLEIAPRILPDELDRVLVHIAGHPDLQARMLRAYRDLAARAPQATDTISLAAAPSAPAPRRIERVSLDLLRAARWFLEKVRPAPQKGFGRVKERDRFTCQNPECGRCTLRAHAHHYIFKSKGGGDSLENGICLCPACHLRLLHAGRISVERHGDLHIWTYPGRRVVVGSGGAPFPGGAAPATGSCGIPEEEPGP